MFAKKSKKKGSGVTVITINNDEFIHHLNHIHTTQYVPEIIEKAKDDATHNIPGMDTASMIHFEPIRTKYNRLILDYKSKSNINEQQYNANKDIAQFKKLRKRVSDKLQQVRNNLRIKERTIENLNSCKQSILLGKKAGYGIFLLTGSEVIFASSSFQIFVQNLMLSFIVGATFGVALYYSAVLGAKLLRKAKKRLQFIGIFASILLVIGAVFATLGHFRIVYLQQMSDGENIGNHLSAFQFAGIQLFLFTCAILLKYFFMPTREEQESYREWKEAKNDLGKLKKQEKSLEDTIENLEAGLDKTLITRRSLISKAADIELKIVTLYRDCCSNYIQGNLFHRDLKGKVPVSFQDPEKLPKLTLFFQDPKLLEFNETLLTTDV